MKCAKLQLQERVKPVVKQQTRRVDKPRRYCQKRMVNPEHNEDPRWNKTFDRFYCNTSNSSEEYNQSSGTLAPDKEENLYLSIQNLKFQGDTQERKRPRTSFKYKSHTDNQKHRMFVKQTINDCSAFEDDKSSELSNYFFDNYLKYILSTDRSRPSSSKSSVFLQDLSNKFLKEAPQANSVQLKKPYASDTKGKTSPKKPTKQRATEVVENKVHTNTLEDAKVIYHKSEKRKSLTISRAPSPETVQVIRVDVVRNCSTGSTASDNEDKISPTKVNIPKLSDKDRANIKLKDSHFSDKYLLTNTVTSIRENLSCGSKVTLLCKTFKLSDRLKFAERQIAKTAQNIFKKNSNIINSSNMPPS